MTTTETKAKPEKVSVTISAPAGLRERDKALEKAELRATIATAEDYAAAVAWLQERKADDRAWAERFLEARRPLADAQKKSIALEKDFLKPLRDAIAVVGAAVETWRKEAQAREEKLRQEAREAAEAQAREERAKQQAALEAAAKATPSRGEKKALRGQIAQLKAAPLVTAPARVESTVPKISGVYDVETWDAEVVDLPSLVAAVAIPILLARVRTEIELTHEDYRPGDASVRVGLLEEVHRWLDRQPRAVSDAILPNQAWLDAMAVRCQADIPIPGVVGRKTVKTVVRGAQQAAV